MWASTDITIEIEVVDGSEMIVVIGTPAGTIMLEGGVRLVEGILSIEGAHVQGLFPGALTRAGLNAIGSRILEVTGARSLVLQRGTRTIGRNPGRASRRIRFPHPVSDVDTG